MPTDYMYSMKCSQDGNFSKGELQRFGNIELSPASGILNYGQVCFATCWCFFLNLKYIAYAIHFNDYCSTFVCHTLLNMLLEILIGIV